MTKITTTIVMLMLLTACGKAAGGENSAAITGAQSTVPATAGDFLNPKIPSIP